ncbi:hypothetical protein GQX73_g2292 [Xylaria multiplex]|uniref:tRNA/rRNA methyltransferase SpoU type domain-containing protein n=1 Tax=Xylaria multiplex TaxID=323545 RepID=A0A7C8IVJ1_9PEZI|nr:hypothetical protein GQX73_g2292 [Xylaria multiplex]
MHQIVATRIATIPSRPASSLSGIHNGLRQSEKSRPQGFNQSSSRTTKYRLPSKGRNRDPDWTPPDFKIKRGKKDVTDTGPGRQSRRSRFNDPENSFGKRSLVYQMKHGGLKEKMAESGGRGRNHKTSSLPRSSSDRMTSSDFMRDFRASTGQESKPFKNTGRTSSRPESPAHTRRPPGREPRSRFDADPKNSFDKTRRPRTDISSPSPQHKDFANAPSIRTRHESSSDRPEQPTRLYNRDEQDPRKEQQENRKVDDGPIRIHHTTAASQFLQLYKLYIYNGDDRRNVPQDDMLARLARQKGIDVTKVPNEGIRMLDKMSSGRPHNGCVLEASPLPQPPLKALGPLSEDPKTPGFHVKLAYQSSEEAKVNGTSDFISYHLPKERNPFILLLDGILDPGNLGAILRTAAFLGVNGIAITKSSSATLTPVALKASAGASEVITLFSIESTVDFLTRSKENGWMVYAAVPSPKRSKQNSHLTVDRVETYDPLSSQPTVLVIGSEGEGLPRQVRRQADHEVSIPSPSSSLSSVVDSLNVSVATGILCSAFLKKQSSGMMEIEEGSEDDSDSSLW